MRPVAILMLSTAFAIPCRLVAQTHDVHEHTAAHDDSAFRAMQARGRGVMGVDQYTSVHRFDALPDGGRIELQRDRDDSTGVTAIRAHLRTIARAFSAGDFAAPFVVHEETVPGVPAMRARRSAIRYEVSDLPRGAQLRIHSADPVAIEGIHRFLAFQRREHRTGPAVHAQ
jgi:hypothetical protein